MIPILLGHEYRTEKKVFLDPDDLRTHLHLIGATGAGKTTAIHTMLRALMLQPRPKCCIFIVDPMGNLSSDLLRFIANERFCPQHVRRRLVYIEPARGEVLPFNPLLHRDETERYYQTMRAVDLVLRAWAAQDVSQQPRLLQWTYKAFCAAAMLGLPIAMCRFLIHPGTEEHAAILKLIPGEIVAQWSQILQAKGGEAVRILESTRNRLDPFFECAPLRRMFGCRQSRFDCERLIRERRIVIINVAKYGRLPGFTADAIGALALNEIFEAATRMATNDGPGTVDPTYILMDEFQRFVSVDIEEALPTVRQMGLRLILAHQSFSQLEREDVDLSNMVWQAQTRLIFANSALDADILADELAKRTFNSKRIKDVRETVRQIIVGYRKEWLQSTSTSSSQSRSRQSGRTTGFGQTSGESLAPDTSIPTVSKSSERSSSDAASETFGDTSQTTDGRSQANVPIHKTFREVSSITYENFEEFSIEWGQKIRRLNRGQAFAIFPGDRVIPKIMIDHLPIHDTLKSKEAVEKLRAANFASDFFISADEADRQAEQLRQQVLRGTFRPEHPPDHSSPTEQPELPGEGPPLPFA